jgi:hypothetical protein
MNKKKKQIVSGIVVVFVAIFSFLYTNYSGVEGYYMKYEWVNQPKMGSVVLKVNVFDKNNNKFDTKVFVNYDMPSMRGHHSTTEQMKQNNKGDYLLPVNFVMQGDWEVIITAGTPEQELKETILINLK